MDDCYPNTDLNILFCAMCGDEICTVHDGLIVPEMDQEDGDVVCKPCSAKYALVGTSLALDPAYAPAA